jgi:hypothetical protein
VNNLFTVYYHNVGGMRSKSSLFTKFLHSSCFPVYVLCETWFHAGISSNEFFNSEYVVYRCDRSVSTSGKSSGGGVLVAVHNSIRSSTIMCVHNNVEYVAVKLYWPSKSMYLYAAYIPPMCSADVYNCHCDNITNFISCADITDIVCVLGDFNLPGVNWCVDSEELTYLFPSNVTSIEEQIFIDSMMALNLQQICSISNMNNKLLDLVFLNEPNYGLVIKSLAPFDQEKFMIVG